jgi:hypothetical protein
MGSWLLFLAYALFTLLVGRFCVRGWLGRWRHPDLVALGCQYAKLLRSLPEKTAMLDREDRKVFLCYVSRLAGRWVFDRRLQRIDEDLVHELGDLATGRRSELVMESLHRIPWELVVSRRLVGDSVEKQADGGFELAPSVHESRRPGAVIWRLHTRAKSERMLRKTALPYLDADELRQLLAQLDRAEVLPAGGSPDALA